jgi:hypothetical protein
MDNETKRKTKPVPPAAGTLPAATTYTQNELRRQAAQATGEEKRVLEALLARLGSESKQGGAR